MTEVLAPQRQCLRCGHPVKEYRRRYCSRTCAQRMKADSEGTGSPATEKRREAKREAMRKKRAVIRTNRPAQLAQNQQQTAARQARKEDPRRHENHRFYQLQYRAIERKRRRCREHMRLRRSLEKIDPLLWAKLRVERRISLWRWRESAAYQEMQRQKKSAAYQARMARLKADEEALAAFRLRKKQIKQARLARIKADPAQLEKLRTQQRTYRNTHKQKKESL